MAAWLLYSLLINPPLQDLSDQGFLGQDRPFQILLLPKLGPRLLDSCPLAAVPADRGRTWLEKYRRLTAPSMGFTYICLVFSIINIE